MPVYEMENADQLEIEVILSASPTIVVQKSREPGSAIISMPGPQGASGGSTPHAQNHATGGSDVLTAADIGAFPNPTGLATQVVRGNGTLSVAGSSSNFYRGDGQFTTITNSQVSNSAAIAESKLSLASDAAANVASRRTLGTVALSAAAGDDARIVGAVQESTRNAAGGFFGLHPTANVGAMNSNNFMRADGNIRQVTDVQVDPNNKDGLATLASMRTLGTGAQQAAAGNDSRIVGAVQESTRNQQGGFFGVHASAIIANMTSSNVMRADGHPVKLTDTYVATANKDGLATVASMRTLGTGEFQAAAGNDARFTTATTALAANGKGFMAHGTNANTARPSGFASVEWLGTIAPVNAINGDTWINA